MRRGKDFSDYMIVGAFGIIGAFGIVGALIAAVVGLASCGKPKIQTENKAEGEVEVRQEVSITQDVCVEKNGFLTPEDRRECILCLSKSALCRKCEPAKD